MRVEDAAGVRAVATKSRRGWRGLEAVADEVRGAGPRAITALVDVRSVDQIQEAVELADRTFGRIGILVNNTAAPPGADRVPVGRLALHPIIVRAPRCGAFSRRGRALPGLLLGRGAPAAPPGVRGA